MSMKVQSVNICERLPVPEGGAIPAVPRGRHEDLLRGVEDEPRPSGQVGDACIVKRLSDVDNGWLSSPPLALNKREIHSAKS